MQVVVKEDNLEWLLIQTLEMPPQRFWRTLPWANAAETMNTIFRVLNTRTGQSVGM